MIWLSRRRQFRRPLANEDAVEAIAQDCGFEIVHSEEMNLIDQIRLMAQASKLAGAVGANLTNLVFARSGVEVLGFVGEEEAYPTFVDLCAVMGLKQRWQFGRVDPRAAWWGPIHKPYEVNLDVARRELERLAQPISRRTTSAVAR